MVRLRSPQVRVLRNLLALLLVLPLLLSVFALFSLGPAVPEAQAATLCPEFKSGSLSPSDVAVNPNKIREEDTVAKACSAGGIIGWVKCKIAEFFTDLRGTGDLDLRDSQMPAYLRRANELALSGDLEKREEPGGITGSIAKMLPPGYKQDNLDPIKELTESEGQLVTGKIFLNNNALQKTFTETVYEEPDLNSVKGYYDLEVGSGNSNYQVEGRFGEVAPLYDRFGLLKQALLPFASEVGIPTDDCIGYDPSIIAVTGFNQANPLRDVPWTAFQPILEADRQPVDVQCTQTGTSTCPEGASNYATPTICTIGCSGTCVNSNVGVKKCCCPTGKVCSVFTPIYSCPATAGTKTYEVGGNLDVQTQVSLASETWERIGAVSSNPGEGGVFNVLLPPGTSFRTDQAKPQLKFDYAPHTQAQYSDGSTLNIADLGNVKGALDCIVNGLTAHPANANPTACSSALEFFPGLPISCTDEATPLPTDKFPSNSGSAVAERARAVVNNLYQGFWCSWNWSKTDYPELFNETLFQQNPNPSRSEVENCADCLFWCTWLVWKTHSDHGPSLNSQDMKAYYESQGRFKDVAKITYQDVSSGDVVFFDVHNSLPRLDHVGIVYSVSKDAIVFVQSNAPDKFAAITVSENGKIQDLPWAKVAGFGSP